ncbi:MULTISPECIES: hypothetical protein [Streptomyces]|uniref:OmpR/PhoB-type domain-containing protein n=2 Tax=Streptomyces TaxID=1883 RepID=A0ABV9J4L3_9ACTN
MDAHVACLRRKLGDAGWITTTRGVGFRLTEPPGTGDSPPGAGGCLVACCSATRALPCSCWPASSSPSVGSTAAAYGEVSGYTFASVQPEGAPTGRG